MIALMFDDAPHNALDFPLGLFNLSGEILLLMLADAILIPICCILWCTWKTPSIDKKKD
jgi:hypothetical protein